MRQGEAEFLEDVFNKHVFIARLIELDGSVRYCVTDTFSKPIAFVNDVFWCRAIEFFGVIRSYPVSQGGTVEVIDPDFVTEDKRSGQVPF
jgi:hypothetical protein